MEEHGAAAMFEKNKAIFMNPAGEVVTSGHQWSPWGSGDVGSVPMSSGGWPPLADSFTTPFLSESHQPTWKPEGMKVLFGPRNWVRRTTAKCLAVADDN